MAKWFDKQLEDRPALTITVLVLAVVVVASATGILGAVTAPVSRAVGGLKFKLMGLFGKGEQREAQVPVQPATVVSIQGGGTGPQARPGLAVQPKPLLRK